MRLQKDLTRESLENLNRKLEELVVRLNRRARLGMVRDWAFGQYLSDESYARQIGNEIRRRKGLQLNA
jgi:hypothetical protein